MKPTLQPILSTQNAHLRDQNIRFFENGHKYTILSDPKSTYTSVTTWNHAHFPKFDADSVIHSMMKGKGWKEGHKYWGQTPEQIKQLWDTIIITIIWGIISIPWIGQILRFVTRQQRATNN
jgi:hypothetical protein